MTMRMDMVFEAERVSAGWTESWYLGGTDLNAGLAIADLVGRARLNCLARNFFLDFVRVTVNTALAVPQQARRQREVLIRSLQLRGYLGNTSESGDMPWAALKIRWRGANPKCFRVQNLRGIPDNLWTAGGPANLIAQFTPALTPYKQVVIQQNCQMRHAEVTNPATFSYTNVIAAEIENLSRRATGRPPFLPRGRRSKRPVQP